MCEVHVRVCEVHVRVVTVCGYKDVEAMNLTLIFRFLYPNIVSLHKLRELPLDYSNICIFSYSGLGSTVGSVL